ncbi:MAG: FAD-binding protein [Bacteroidetes bacterium]|nr:FAD-binding protein [Bacteroidota bacterium]
MRIVKQIAVKSGVSLKDIYTIRPIKRSIDARGKNVIIRLVVDVFTNDKPPFEAANHSRKLQNISNSEPVVIIGAGPAGLFAAIRLIEQGFKPIIIERGKNVKERRRDLASLNKDRIVDPDSNYCFGEGGAGTYSDGKLYTRADKRGNVQQILNTFIQFGASPDIAVDAHPHIGTNKLPGIIEAMRNAIIDCGGDFLFNTRFTGLVLDGNAVCGVRTKMVNSSSAETIIKSRVVILATGHSARDVFELLNAEGIAIESKPFALGVRIEHPQSLIDSLQYHCDLRNPYLPPASYSLSAQANGKGVYSFCMCPGGIIAAAATAPGEVVVNGWSPSKRNNPYSNSGLVVSVDDINFKPYEKSGELRALNFQKSVEQKCFEAGGNNLTAPAQRMMDFINNQSSSSLPSCSYIPGLQSVNLNEVLPKSVADTLREGLKIFGNKMRGYATNEAVLVATESRTSSPVRIPRDKETLMHPQISGLYPCGEGAGYAGGIMSAAMDGERVADKCSMFFQTHESF